MIGALIIQTHGKLKSWTSILLKLPFAQKVVNVSQLMFREHGLQFTIKHLRLS